MKDIKKLMITLVALLAVTTGAWADETPLVTIESKDNTSFKSGSKTFDDKVTVTFRNSVLNSGNTHGWFATSPALLTVAGTNGYTITSCKFYTVAGVAATGYTVEGESPSVYLSGMKVYNDANQSVKLGTAGVTKIEVFGAAASSPSGPKVAWDKDKKTGTFTMPGGNVTLEPEYYPQAALAAAPTAINDVPATTDGAIVNAGTVKNIGETTTAQGTLMYYVSQTALDDAALLALAADQWTADVPTAESLTEACNLYIYYYVKGNDSDTDEENFSDGDILAANALFAVIADAPTYAVTFADDTAEPDKWKAEPNTGMKKGQTVTVTYTGSKKVLGVKAEKKAAAKPLANATTEDLGKVVGADGNIYANKAAAEAVATGNAVAMICYVNEGHGLALALSDMSSYGNSWDNSGTYNEGKTAAELCSAWNTSKAVTGATWKLASLSEMNLMINAAGNYAALRDGFSAVGGTNMSDDYYWLSDESSANYAKNINFSDGYTSQEFKNDSWYVRACLAF